MTMTDAAAGRAPPPPPPRTSPGGSAASARRPSRRTRPGRRSSDVPAMACASPVDTDSHVGLDAAALSPPPSNEEEEDDEEDVTPLPPASAMLGGDGGTVSQPAQSRGEEYTFGRRKDRGDAPGPRGRRAGGGDEDASPSGTAPHLSPERDRELFEANSAALSAGRDYLADLFRTRDGLERSKPRYSFRRMSSGGPVPDLDEVNIGEAGGGDPSSVNLHRIKGSVGGSPGEGLGSAGPSPVYDRSGSFSTPGGRCEYFDGGGSPDDFRDDDDDFGFGFSTAGHGYAASFLAGLLARRRALVMALGLALAVLAAAAAAGSVGGRTPRGVRGGGRDPPAVAADGSRVHVEDADGPTGVMTAADGGCRDDPDFEFQSDGEVRDCAGWVGTAARSQLWPAALEERCNGPIGMQGYGGDDLLVRDYCRRSCGNCDGDADSSVEAEEEAADVPTRPQGAEEQQSQQMTQQQPSQQSQPQSQPQTTSPPCEDETDRIDLGGGIVDDCEGWLSGFGGMVLESRCRLVQGTGLRVADYCRRSCGNCPRPPGSAGQEAAARAEGGPSPGQAYPGQVAAPPATTAAMMSATTATTAAPPGPAQPPQVETGPSFPPGPPPQHTSGCSDDAAFTFYHEDKLKDCEDWVANVGRPSLHEQRCQEPVGTRTHNGVVLRLRDYCRKSCHICS